MEIERKFLVSEPPHALPDVSSASLRQGYLVVGAEGEVRLRAAGSTCFLTVKSGSGMVRQEYEVVLTSEQFESLWPATAGRRLEKRRFVVPAGDLRYEVDVYTGALQGLMAVEVEFPTLEAAEAFEPPAWFGAEVTDDPAYKNASLAVHGAPPAREPGR